MNWNELNMPEKDKLEKEIKAAAVFTALVQHGLILRKRPGQVFAKKDSEWKKKRINGLR